MKGVSQLFAAIDTCNSDLQSVKNAATNRVLRTDHVRNAETAKLAHSNPNTISNNKDYQGDHSPDTLKFPDNVQNSCPC